MRTASYDMYTQSTHASGENWATMKQEYPNIQVKRFPDEVIEAMRAANTKLLKEKAEADPMAKEIIESQAKYLKQVRAWTNIADKQYLDSIAGE